VSGPSQLPPPPSASQDSSSFATGDRNIVTTTSSSVHDAVPELPRRPAAAAGSHSRSSSLDNQLIDFSDSGQLLSFAECSVLLLGLVAIKNILSTFQKLMIN